MSTLQHPSSFCHQPGDSFWDAPRLHKDKIYRDSAKPATALGSMDTRREEFPSVSPRVPLLDLRSKSGPAIPTVKSLGLRISPTASVDMSTSRFSLDVRSLSASSQHQPERPGGLAQGLRSKSSRLMRRQNSRSNSGTLVWLDDSGDRPKRSSVYDLWSRSTSGHSRIRSAGDSFVDKREISEPYNFQHLTHTHAQQFQEIERVDHHDLVNEFAAIRASQAPRRELKGIRAESLPSKKSQSEPASPTRQAPSTPACRSPVRPTYLEKHRNLAAGEQHAHQADYFSQPTTMSRPHRASNIPRPPPPRSSSRTAVSTAPDFFTDYHENPNEQLSPIPSNSDALATADPTVSYPSQDLLSENSNAFHDFDFSVVPHAVTTPDDSAFPLTPSRVRVPGAELADVPEEDERTTGTCSRPSTPLCGLRYAKSFPSTRSNSQRWSRSPRKALGKGPNSIGLREEDLSQSELSLPLVGEPFDDIPIRPRLSKRMSRKTQQFDASWEDDIDYCYEHAAEADCDFDWDRVSIKDGNADDGLAMDGATAQRRTRYNSEGYGNICYPAPLSTSRVAESSSLPRLHTSLSVPPLSSSNSANSPSIASLATPATPSHPLPSPQPYGLSNRSFLGSSDAVNLGPPLPGYMDGCPSAMSEEVYDNLFLNKRDVEEELPLHTLRFEPVGSHDDSPRSSRSPISKCNSQESFMLSWSSSMRYPRSCDSFGSVPDLVHSKTSRDIFDVSAEQLMDLAATIKAAEMCPDVKVPLRQRSAQTLAKDLARNSMHQKASSFHNVEEEGVEDSEVVPSLSHHERSQSAAVPQPLSTSAPRKRSKSSATALTKASRGSYSLFPPPLRSPM